MKQIATAAGGQRRVPWWFTRSATAVLLSLGLLACSSGSSPQAQTGPINVGVTAGFSGTNVIYGTPLLDGATVAANYVNNNGGILGRNLNVIPVNTASDPVDAVTAVRQMLAVDNVSVTIGLAALDWTDALPILNQAKMVSFTHIGDPAIDNLTMPYSWSTAPSDAVEGAAIAEYAFSQGYHKIAIAFDASSSAQTLVPNLVKAAGILGLQVVAKPAVPVGAPSYEAVVKQIVDAKPDVIMMQLDPGTAGTFFPALKTLGGTGIPIIGSDVTLDPNFVKAVGAQEYADHITSVEAATQATGPGLATFNTGYQNAYNKQAPFLAIYAYDGMTVAALAMVAAKSSDPKVYNNSILDVTTPGNGKTEVYDFKTGSQLLSQGKKIKYVGVGTPMIYNQYHRVTATFAAEKGSTSGTVTLVTLIPADALLKLI
jgi:branched-chain amino acid transport system substrate-binding protein